MRIARAGLLLLLLGIHWPASALDPAKSIFQYNCQTWRRQNGLTANGVNAITQTRDGYIWLGTSAGLVRFDGSEFKLVDLSGLPKTRSSAVTGLASSRGGGFWFGLAHGAFGFCDGKNVSLRGREEWAGMDQNVHSIIEATNGDVWVAAETQSGRMIASNVYVGVFAEEEGQPSADVLTTYQDSKGRVWFGTAQNGLSYFEHGVMTKFPDPELDHLTIGSIV